MIYRKISILVRLYNLLGLGLFRFVLINFFLRFPANFKIFLFGNSASVTIWDRSDLLLFKEIFLHGEYNLKLIKEPEVIVDLGANIGYSSIYFHLKYPMAKIYAFEPGPKTFDLLKENIGVIPEIEVFNLAVSSETGERYLYSNESKASASFSERGGQKSGVSVETLSLDDLLSKLDLRGVDILKFDIEGAEGGIFSKENVSTIKQIVGEVHFDLMEKKEAQELLDCLSKNRVFVSKRISSKRVLISSVSKSLDPDW